MAPIISENSIATNKTKKSKKITTFHRPNLRKYLLSAVSFDKCFFYPPNQSVLTALPILKLLAGNSQIIGVLENLSDHSDHFLLER
jgi:hypothetical protein